MRTGQLMFMATAGLAVLLFQAVPGAFEANAQSAAALTGQVTSAEEGAMEGVVVSARKDGSTITISVVSDAQGRYSFPATRLEPGRYALKIRAVGYQLDGAGTAEIARGKAATTDLKLRKTKELAAQLTNGEWLASMPGTENQKKFLLGCLGCHNLQKIVSTTHDAEGFLKILERMAGYYPGSTPQYPQRLAGTALRQGLRTGPESKANAEWLATINLSSGPTWEYPFKTLPRPTGRATRVIITEYDLPQDRIQPHDVMLDRTGNVWYSDFGQMFLGRMDPKSGKVTQYPIPVVKPGWPLGSLDLEFDKDDNPWLGVMYQSAVARFDRKTEKFQIWSTPKEWDSDAGQLGHFALTGTHVDNKVWIKNSDGGNIYRLDLKSNQFENLGGFKDSVGKRIGTYGIHSDAENNAYLLDFASSNIVRIEGKTKNVTIYTTPTPNSRPRRGRVDQDGRLWFAEYGGNAVGMFDPKTERITEWKVPTPWSAPYDVVVDKNGEAWTGSMLNDLVARIDTRTGRVTEYLMPRSTNIRRVFVDNTTNPVTFWVGSNHGASIVKVEPLD